MNPVTRQPDDLADRFAGAMLGTAFGDALGAAVEGWSAAEIADEYGEIRDYVAGESGAGCYTDDTQMMLATARSIVRMGGIDGADCADACARAFNAERRYGRSATTVLKALAAGTPYDQTATMLFPEGSYGNGAAMRIAPVGLFCGELDLAKMRLRVFETVRSTHVHDEAIDGALILAATVGRFSRIEQSADIDGAAFIRELSRHCRTMTMRSRMMLAAELLDAEVAPVEVVERLGNGVRTIDSVPTALYTAMKFLAEPEEAVVTAISYGGDTDTIAAMTGAVVGALNGAKAFPAKWHRGLERGDDGYEALLDVAARLSSTVR